MIDTVSESSQEKALGNKNVLDLCDVRRDLKKRRYEEEEMKDYKIKTYKRVQKALKEAKEDDRNSV